MKLLSAKLREIALGVLCGGISVAGIALWRHFASRPPAPAPLVTRLDDAWLSTWREDAPPWLMTPIGEMAFDAQPMDRALAGIARRAAVTIVPPRRRLHDPRYGAPLPSIELTRGQTLSSALNGVLDLEHGEFGLYDCCFAESGVIRFTTRQDLGDRLYVRVYDLRGFGTPASESERVWRDEHFRLIARLTAEDPHRFDHNPSYRMALWAGRLIVLHDPAGHAYIERVFRLFATPHLSPPGPADRIRAYDVGDLLARPAHLSRAMRSAPFHVLTREEQADPRSAQTPGTASDPGEMEPSDHRLARDLITALVVSIDTWGSRHRAYYFSGRLIIEQTPENHQHIARLLESLRRDTLPQSGQPSSGQ